jgi:lipase maturation factor 1
MKKFDWRARFDFSGPVVATLFHRLLGLVFLDAWLSLAVQLKVLIGSRGLLPIAPFLTRARPELSFFDFPTLLWLGASDTMLVIGVILGVAVALAQIAALRPRTLAAVQVALYLSYVTAGRTFFSFQWDNLILECGFFAAFLPTNRRAAWIHIVFRLILFKLYWESGVAKFQSGNHDWRIGTAMALYYETAPLPTALAWFAHHGSAWWHAMESRATLVFELGVPFAVVAPRRIRQAAAAILTGFQIINILTANYGFFAYLAIVLHLFLLDDADVARLWKRLAAAVSTVEIPRWREQFRVAVAVVVTFFFVAVSTIDGLINFCRSLPVDEALLPWRAHYEPFRLVNTYHLFGQITTERIEPQFETSDGNDWVEHDLRHKPGDVSRRPDWVAPHQPRVDFQLWFYGLGPSHAPAYVETLVERLCHDPAAVQPLFRDPLPPSPRSVFLAVPLHDARRETRQRRLVDARAHRRDAPDRLRHEVSPQRRLMNLVRKIAAPNP